ncbi:hypothetical protein ACF1BN_20635 [Streptomyces sp. NPDC014861]|uniref:hypothetical protein n=1 Tax=Streptomyces sp. NPDC014861 TaxID=3364923 RepID=UPI003700B122
MLTALGILFAVAPTVVWGTIARTRAVGFAVGGMLLAGASLLIGVQQGWLDAPRPDAHLVFTALAPLLIACGAGLEGRHENSPSRQWRSRRKGATGFLGTQFGLTLVAGLPYALLISDGSEAPPSKALPSLPPGLSLVDEDVSCASGGCWRVATVASEDGLSRPEIIRRLGLQQKSCRTNGWLLDRRDLCVGATDDGRNVTITAGVGYPGAAIRSATVLLHKDP